MVVSCLIRSLIVLSGFITVYPTLSSLRYPSVNIFMWFSYTCSILAAYSALIRTVLATYKQTNQYLNPLNSSIFKMAKKDFPVLLAPFDSMLPLKHGFLPMA
jgi:hypothetical protein